MRFLMNLSLFKKLLLSFFIPLAFAFGVIFLSINVLNDFNNRISSLVENGVQALVENTKCRRAVFQLRMLEHEVFLQMNENEKVRVLYQISTTQEEVRSRFKRLMGLKLDSEILKLVETFAEKYSDYNITLTEILHLVEIGKSKEAVELSLGKSAQQAEAAWIVANDVTSNLEKRFAAENEDTNILLEKQIKITVFLSLFVLFITILMVWVISRSISGRVKQLVTVTNAIAGGDFNIINTVDGSDEIGRLASSIEIMKDKLSSSYQEISSQDWLKTGLAQISKTILGQNDSSVLASKVIKEIVEFVGAQVGTVYLLKDIDNDVVLSLTGTYAYSPSNNTPIEFKYGEGLVGQAALSRKQILIADIPKDYLSVTSGLGGATPRSICLVPLLFEDNLQGVMEIGTVNYLNNLQLDYIGQVSEIIATAFEITLAQERIQNQQIELAAANEKLRALDQMKTNFLSTVSHELRTPLTSVIGFARIMQKKFETVLYPALSDNEDKKVQKAIRQVMDNTSIIVEEGQRLTALINDVLDLAKMEAGRVDWNITELHIEDIIDRGIASTSSLFANKPVKLRKDVAANLPLCEGDRDRLIQVVINLISNAIKFTDEGEVTLKAEVNRAELVVSVIDSGTGIKSEDQPLVFEKFKQVGDTMTDKPQGTGLGLPICKEIIEHLGGRLWLESEVGVGSTFSFSLPLAEQQVVKNTFFSKEGRRNKNTLLTNDGEEVSYVWQSDSESLERAIRVSFEKLLSPGASKQPNILVVDDNLNIRQFLHQELSTLDYEVREASSGAEGLAMIAEQKPDLIILDVKMPHLNGFEVAVRLHTHPVTLDIPIVLHTIAEDQMLADQLGIESYLRKPVKDTDLLATVNNLLKAPRERKKILLFIADSGKRSTWVSLLDKCGFETVAAEDVNQGINSALAFYPQLVIAEASLVNKFKIIDRLRGDLGLEKILFTLLDDSQSI